MNKVSDAINFLPVFSKEQRKMYAEIAIGSTLPLHFYEGLHDQVLALPEPIHVEPCLQSESATGIMAEKLQGNTVGTALLYFMMCNTWAILGNSASVCSHSGIH